MNGWVDGCEGAKASLWIAYSNYKYLGYWLEKYIKFMFLVPNDMLQIIKNVKLI